MANGVRVVGLDPVASRRELALKGGALACADPTGEALSGFELDVAGLTSGLGVDQVFLVAGGSSNQPVEIAARIARDRGRIVDIGKTSLDLPWNDYYEKELDVRFSRSYGPGRYDETYELDGVDYPAGYVRWTEGRNMACFLDLVARGDLDLAPLVSGVLPVDDATDVYRRLGDGTLDGIGYLFSYDGNDEPLQQPTGRARRVLPRRRDRSDAGPASARWPRSGSGSSGRATTPRPCSFPTWLATSG